MCGLLDGTLGLVESVVMMAKGMGAYGFIKKHGSSPSDFLGLSVASMRAPPTLRRGRKCHKKLSQHLVLVTLWIIVPAGHRLVVSVRTIGLLENGGVGERGQRTSDRHRGEIVASLSDVTPPRPKGRFIHCWIKEISIRPEIVLYYTLLGNESRYRPVQTFMSASVTWLTTS